MCAAVAAISTTAVACVIGDRGMTKLAERDGMLRLRMVRGRPFVTLSFVVITLFKSFRVVLGAHTHIALTITYLIDMQQDEVLRPRRRRHRCPREHKHEHAMRESYANLDPNKLLSGMAI